MVKVKDFLKQEKEAGVLIFSAIKGLSLNTGTSNSINFEFKKDRAEQNSDHLITVPFYVLKDMTLLSKFDGRKHYEYLSPSVAGYIVLTKTAAKTILGFKRYRKTVSKTRAHHVLNAIELIMERINEEVRKELL